MDSSLSTISNDNTGDVSNPTIPTLSVMYHTWTIGAPIGGISDSFKLTWKIFNYTAYYLLLYRVPSKYTGKNVYLQTYTAFTCRNNNEILL